MQTIRNSVLVNGMLVLATLQATSYLAAQSILNPRDNDRIGEEFQFEFMNSTVIVPANQTAVRFGNPTRITDVRSNLVSISPSFLSGPAVSAGWASHGGNAQRNGMFAGVGPGEDMMLWENDNDFAIIAFQPFVGEDVYAVRMRDFITNQAADEIVAFDFETGEELWCILLPFAGDSSQQWTAHILGVNNGVVYVSRSGNGNSIEAPVMALDASDGSLIWESTVTTDTGFNTGAVFAPDGDLIIGSFEKIQRINAVDGSEVWSTPRTCPVSGGCGTTISKDGVFINIVRPNFFTAVAKYDLATGQLLYMAPDTPGFITQNNPFVSQDGTTIYHAKQHGVGENFLYAYTDTGSELIEQWMVPIAFSAGHLHGIGPDGSIYTVLENDEFVRLDPATGQVVDSAGVLLPRGSAPRTAVDISGNVYFSNGWASSPAGDGRLWAFTPDLNNELFTLELNRQNSGGPGLGIVTTGNGTLVISDRSSVRAYRAPKPLLLGDVNGDGVVDLLDVAPFVMVLQSGEFNINADMNQDGSVDLLDVQLFVAAVVS